MDLKNPGLYLCQLAIYMYDILYGCLSKQVKLAVITLTLVCVAKPLCVYVKIITDGIHSNGTREV